MAINCTLYVHNTLSIVLNTCFMPLGAVAMWCRMWPFQENRHPPAHGQLWVFSHTTLDDLSQELECRPKLLCLVVAQCHVVLELRLQRRKN